METEQMMAEAYVAKLGKVGDRRKLDDDIYVKKMSETEYLFENEGGGMIMDIELKRYGKMDYTIRRWSDKRMQNEAFPNIMYAVRGLTDFKRCYEYEYFAEKETHGPYISYERIVSIDQDGSESLVPPFESLSARMKEFKIGEKLETSKHFYQSIGNFMENLKMTKPFDGRPEEYLENLDEIATLAHIDPKQWAWRRWYKNAEALKDYIYDERLSQKEREDRLLRLASIMKAVGMEREQASAARIAVICSQIIKGKTDSWIVTYHLAKKLKKQV